MKKTESEIKDSESTIYKDSSVYIRANSLCYCLELKGKAPAYYSDMEGVLRGIMQWALKEELKHNYKKNNPALLELVKSLEKAELRMKKVAQAIPFRELPEAPDVHVDAKDYFDRTEE